MLKRIIAFSLILGLMLLSFSSASGGTESDPVVTRSYMTETFKPQILSKAYTAINSEFSKLSTQLNQMFGANAARAGLYAAAYLKSGSITSSDNGKPNTYVVSAGSVISGALGTAMTLTSGSAVTYSPNGNVIVNVTDGEAYLHGNAVIPNNCYMVADEGLTGIRILSEAIVTVEGGYTIIGTAIPYSLVAPIDPANYTEQYTKYAHALNAMGLFLGTNNGYSLTRSANRAEAITMLIRILGEEKQALAFQGSHPFTDVPAWADRYVAYAYNMGYTNGVSATRFGANNPVSEVQYMTFLLRSLGYSDAAGDFYWENANTAAVSFGVLTAAEELSMRQIFFRDQMVYSSYLALYANLKGTTTPLYQKLLDMGAITIETLYQAQIIVG